MEGILARAFSAPGVDEASFQRRRVIRAAGLSLVLLLAFVMAFRLNHDRGIPDGQIGLVTANHLAVAANLSLEHGLLGFYRQRLSRAGELTYEAYNRFPLVGHLLIKAAILPFPTDLWAQIQAARTLSLAFMAAAAVAAYLSLRRLSSSPIALTATLLSFSSFQSFYYGGMIATEGSIDLFAVLLTFHGMVVFAQEGRFRQLLAKTCAALLLGWHVYGLLLPFIAFGLAGEQRRKRGTGAFLGSLVRSRHLALGAVALSFGLAVLAFNFAREYAMLNSSDRETTDVAKLPSYLSMRSRLGQESAFNERYASQLAWPRFLKELSYRAGQSSVPYYWATDRTAWATWGGVAFGVCVAGLAFVRCRILLATLAASGFCWSLLVRGNAAFHEYEGMFLAGLPLAFFTLVMLLMRRLSERLAGGCAVVALLVFVLSAQKMNLDSGAEAIGDRETISEFDVIRSIAAEGLGVIVQEEPPLHGNLERRTTNFYLAGRILTPHTSSGRFRHRADFLLTRERTSDGLGLLTPGNRQVFLYNRAAYDLQYVALGDPILEGGRGWKVHLVGSRLIYTTHEACDVMERNLERFFFLELSPAGEDAEAVLRHDFWLTDRRMFEVAGRCIAELRLPTGDFARLRTGNITDRGGAPVWSEEYVFRN